MLISLAPSSSKCNSLFAISIEDPRAVDARAMRHSSPTSRQQRPLARRHEACLATPLGRRRDDSARSASRFSATFNDGILIMGKLLYGTPPTDYEVEDRLLAHLQVVIVNKFRRNESFAFNLPESAEASTGRHTLWLNPTIPVQFSFYGSRTPALNPRWVQHLMNEANSGRGLSTVPEPAQRAVPRHDTVAS